MERCCRGFAARKSGDVAAGFWLHAPYSMLSVRHAYQKLTNSWSYAQVAAKTMTPKDMEMQLQAKEQEGKEGRKGSLGPGWDEFFWKSENQR
eukprot:1160432-Pelagomonas_calceolata.AAC.19